MHREAISRDQPSGFFPPALGDGRAIHTPRYRNHAPGGGKPEPTLESRNIASFHSGRKCAQGDLAHILHASRVRDFSRLVGGISRAESGDMKADGATGLELARWPEICKLLDIETWIPRRQENDKQVVARVQPSGRPSALHAPWICHKARMLADVSVEHKAVPRNTNQRSLIWLLRRELQT